MLSAKHFNSLIRSNDCDAVEPFSEVNDSQLHRHFHVKSDVRTHSSTSKLNDEPNVDHSLSMNEMLSIILNRWDLYRKFIQAMLIRNRNRKTVLVASCSIETRGIYAKICINSSAPIN